MHHLIVILDDEAERIREMTACLRDRKPQCEIVTFDNAPDTIAWLANHLDEAAVMCLDHDLGPNRIRDGETFDPGTGRDVADYLATRTPTSAIVIHTTNSLAAPGMIMVLEDAGWRVSRVLPYNDLEWIRAVWVNDVFDALRQWCAQRYQL